MSESSKIQPYTYTAKSITAVNHNFGFGNTMPVCFDGVVLYMVPPDEAISIENLYCRIRFRFSTGVSSGLRVLQKIGIANQFVNPNSPWPFPLDPIRFKYYDVNQTADGNRYVDVRINLSELLKKDDIQYRERFGDWPNAGYTFVNLVFDSSLGSGQPNANTNIGTIELWKLDALFTTRGIV